RRPRVPERGTDPETKCRALRRAGRLDPDGAALAVDRRRDGVRRVRADVRHLVAAVPAGDVELGHAGYRRCGRPPVAGGLVEAARQPAALLYAVRDVAAAARALDPFPLADDADGSPPHRRASRSARRPSLRARADAGIYDSRLRD